MLRPKQTITVGGTLPDATTMEDGSLFINIEAPGNPIYQASQSAKIWTQIEGLTVTVVDRGDSMFEEEKEEEP